MEHGRRRLVGKIRLDGRNVEQNNAVFVNVELVKLFPKKLEGKTKLDRSGGWIDFITGRKWGRRNDAGWKEVPHTVLVRVVPNCAEDLGRLSIAEEGLLRLARGDGHRVHSADGKSLLVAGLLDFGHRVGARQNREHVGSQGLVVVDRLGLRLPFIPLAVVVVVEEDGPVGQSRFVEVALSVAVGVEKLATHNIARPQHAEINSVRRAADNGRD